MPIIKWDASMSVKVTEIDDQHKKLVAMINELNEAMLQAQGSTVLSGILNGLVDYTATHFATEEKFFDRLAYPYASSHIKEHRDFVQKVLEFKDQYTRGKIGLSIDVLIFLSDWLKNHIKISDKKYSPYFNTRGLH